MNRYSDFYRAEERAHRAIAETFRLCPHYDNDELMRAAHIATYERIADKYARMAVDEEMEQAV